MYIYIHTCQTVSAPNMVLKWLNLYQVVTNHLSIIISALSTATYCYAVKRNNNSLITASRPAGLQNNPLSGLTDWI